ncbi:MAG: hypothetical protein Q7W13_00390 [Bacteroidia bacterium]|nr:hypothetical protein [Bacteroidia bacterium]
MRWVKIFLSVLILAILIESCKKKEKEEVIDCSGVSPSYNSDIKPIINANCLSSGCHNGGSSNGDYTSYSGLKAVASSGTLESRVVTNKTMPATSPLSLEDRKKIKCWINSGAPNN